MKYTTDTLIILHLWKPALGFSGCSLGLPSQCWAKFLLRSAPQLVLQLSNSSPETRFSWFLLGQFDWLVYTHSASLRGLCSVLLCLTEAKALNATPGGAAVAPHVCAGDQRAPSGSCSSGENCSCFLAPHLLASRCSFPVVALVV